MPDASKITLQQLQSVCENILQTFGEKILDEFLNTFWYEVSHTY
jgi:hypothetical protein